MEVYRLYWKIPYEGEIHVGLYSSLAEAERAGVELWKEDYHCDVEFKRDNGTNPYGKDAGESWYIEGVVEDLIIKKEEVK